MSELQQLSGAEWLGATLAAEVLGLRSNPERSVIGAGAHLRHQDATAPGLRAIEFEIPLTSANLMVSWYQDSWAQKNGPREIR